MSVLNRSILVILGVSLLCGFRWSLLWGELNWQRIENHLNAEYPTVARMTIHELYDLLSKQQKVFLVDVREREEYEVSHLPGARLVDEVNDDSLNDAAYVVVYCSVGVRSGEFARELQDRGYDNVYNLQGGIFSWANKGLPLVSGGESVDVVHPFSSRWATLLDADKQYYGP